MSLLSQLILTELLMNRYGARLNLAQLAKELSISPGAIRNQITAGEFQIPTYRDGGKRFAAAQDVAEYFDRMREQARGATQAEG